MVYLFFGNKDVTATNGIDFTAVGSYQEFSGGEGELINAADIFVVADAGATSKVLITGYEVIDLGDKPAVVT